MGSSAVPDAYSEEGIHQSLQELLELVNAGDYLMASSSCSRWIEHHERLVRLSPPGRFYVPDEASQRGLGFNRVKDVLAALREASSILLRRPEQHGGEDAHRIQAVPHVARALAIWERNDLD